MLPRVSIVIPVYNGEQTLNACLKSIINVSYPQELIEIIVVDNASTDRTSAIATSFSSVRYIYEANQGRAFARNTGWRHANHSLIAFIDCDVILEKQWIRFMVKLFLSPKIAAAQGKIDLIPLQNKSSIFDRFRKFHKLISTSGSLIETTHFSPYFPILNTASCLYRKEVLEELGGFDPLFLRCEDTDLSLRASRMGYMVGFNEMALSYAQWDKGGFLSYFLREIENARFSILLKRKFYQEKNTLFQNLLQTIRWNKHLFFNHSHSWFVFVEILQKSIFGMAYAYFDFKLKSSSGLKVMDSRAITNIKLVDTTKHNEIKFFLSHTLSLHDNSCISSFKSCDHIRIAMSANEILLYDSKYEKRFIFKNEEFYFLRSFLLDDDYYFSRVTFERYRLVLEKTLTPLMESFFLEVVLNQEKICFNPFLSFKKSINEKNDTENFHASGAREFHPMDGAFFRNIPHEKVAYDFLENHLNKADWHLGPLEEIEVLALNQLCRQDLIVSKSSLSSMLKESFDLQLFLSEPSEVKNNRVCSVPKNLTVNQNLLAQVSGQASSLSIFKSPIKQMNNLMNLSQEIVWTLPWSFDYPMPLYVGPKLKERLLSFNSADWTEGQLKDMLDAGVLISPELENFKLDVVTLQETFIKTQSFHAPEAVSSYITWSMGKFLHLYFNSGKFKTGDFQCAERKAIYDNPICLHLQQGFSTLINRILPFQIKSSFNYSVNYLEHAELYPHKDRVEAPFSMSFALASFKGKERCHYKNVLGHINENGENIEVALADGDIALFNGANLTHYRQPIASEHSIYVIVMHFVDRKYTGSIG